jgi:GrpB-like predicted nucleotidyltransferase (UPF0157 family)
MAYRIKIVDPDPQWPLMFEAEKSRILDAIGHVVVGVEHFGSTSIPGIGAKPIIDILIAIPRLDDAKMCIGPLGAIGYSYIPEYEAKIPFGRFFRKGPEEAPTHHIHMLEPKRNWETNLIVRDYLRSHPVEAAEYLSFKKRLAAEFGTDVDGYTAAKRPYLNTVIEKARAALAGDSADDPANDSA